MSVQVIAFGENHYVLSENDLVDIYPRMSIDHEGKKVWHFSVNNRIVVDTFTGEAKPKGLWGAGGFVSFEDIKKRFPQEYANIEKALAIQNDRYGLREIFGSVFKWVTENKDLSNKIQEEIQAVLPSEYEVNATKRLWNNIVNVKLSKEDIKSYFRISYDIEKGLASLHKSAVSDKKLLDGFRPALEALTKLPGFEGLI